MNFDFVRSQFGEYQTTADNSPVAEQIQALVARYKLEIFRDLERLANEITNMPLSRTVKMQLNLLFCSSTLPDFLLNSKSDLNMVDVNNVIHSAVASTGLSYKVALKLITDVFYGCGLSFAVEVGPKLEGSTVKYQLHALMPSRMAEEEVASAESLMVAYGNAARKKAKQPDEEAKELAAKATAAIRGLCEAGVPRGFYLLGRCLLYGECGTKRNPAMALELMKIASERGVIEASAALGDIYYRPEGAAPRGKQAKGVELFSKSRPWLRNYTLAWHYYTQPGAMAMGKERQSALQDIYRQQSANKTTLFFSGIVLALMALFVITFQQGVFSGASCLAAGTVLLVLSALVYAASIIYHIQKPYNGIRWTVAVQYFLWAIYALIFVLA